MFFVVEWDLPVKICGSYPRVCSSTDSCVHKTWRCYNNQGFFQLFAQWGEGGGGKIRLDRLLGGKYVSVCKVCGKLGGSRGMLPWKILPFIGRNLVESGTVFAQT